MRADEERERTLRTELADLDEQIVSTERALADATAQRDRELLADQIEALAASIERAVPGFGAGADRAGRRRRQGRNRRLPKPRGLRPASTPCGAKCFRPRISCAGSCARIAVRTRAGNANLTAAAPPEAVRRRRPRSSGR